MAGENMSSEKKQHVIGSFIATAWEFVNAGAEIPVEGHEKLVSLVDEIIADSREKLAKFLKSRRVRLASDNEKKSA